MIPLKTRNFLLTYSLCSMFLGLLFYGKVLADPWKDLKSGDQTAQEFLNKIDQKKTEGGASPFYKGISSESSLAAAELKGKAQTLSTKDSASQMVFKSSEARTQFKIDPQKEPLLRDAEKIASNALEHIGGKGTKLARTNIPGGKDEILTCEEAGDDSLETCVRELLVKVVKTKVQKDWKGQFYFVKEHWAEKNRVYLACGALRQRILSMGSFFGAKQGESGNIIAPYKACMQELKGKTTGGCMYLPNHGIKLEQIKEVYVEKVPPPPKTDALFSLFSLLHHFYTNCNLYTVSSGSTSYNCTPRIKIIYEEESYKVLPDEWIANCNRLEERVDQGLCSYYSKACTQGKQTRIIDGVPITRDCWQETYTYSCAYPAKNDCGPLRARGCIQANSVCKQKVGNTCVVYSQTYQCKGHTNPASIDSIAGGNTPFCLDGNCRDQGYDANNEMMSTLAQLSLLKEMQGQIKNGTIFKGDDNRCSKCIVSFKDCCGSGKGWGKDLGLTDCSPEEKTLRQKRDAGLCHYVGTYCAEKLPLVGCIKKKSTYCCFGSKLLKAFHVQGRPQIGLGWGDPKEPTCRGFTVEELQKIDFSKLDLREVYEDLIKTFKPSKMNDIGKKVGESANIIKKGLEDKTLESKTFEPKALDSKKNPFPQTKEPFKQRDEG